MILTGPEKEVGDAVSLQDRDDPARDHGQDPVPRAGRPADVRTPEGRQRQRRQRLLTVKVTCAALLLAQNGGRLLRSMSDKGVVAVLDPRLVTARYGGFLRASLPVSGRSTIPRGVRAALKRLDAARTP